MKIYGDAYKIVLIKQLNVMHPRFVLNDKKWENIIKDLFPVQASNSWRKINVQMEQCEEVTVNAIQIAANKIKNGNAPGKTIPEYIAKVCTKLLKKHF